MDALHELLAVKATPSAKVLALHLAQVTEAGVEQVVRPRDVVEATTIPLYEVERAWREAMKLGWFKSVRPDLVEMAADALPRRALARAAAAPAKKQKKQKQQEIAA